MAEQPVLVVYAALHMDGVVLVLLIVELDATRPSVHAQLSDPLESTPMELAVVHLVLCVLVANAVAHTDIAALDPRIVVKLVHVIY